MTDFVSLFHPCVQRFQFEPAIYNLHSEKGLAHENIFEMSLTVEIFGSSGISF
jgi:hypothetical protein